jgi:catechol 2,3-dioxygenase-like lactoylglutathione lyase family enzyme
MILASAPLIAFLATTDAARARAFYTGALGLTLVEDSPFALVFDVMGTMLRIQKVAALTPHPFTVLGWQVDDVAAAVRELAGRSVTFNHYDGLDQNGEGIWTSPAGARIAWFSDPDGNVLSLTELA